MLGKQTSKYVMQCGKCNHNWVFYGNTEEETGITIESIWNSQRQYFSSVLSKWVGLWQQENPRNDIQDKGSMPMQGLLMYMG